MFGRGGDRSSAGLTSSVDAGDTLAAAIDTNRAVKFAGRPYALAVTVNVGMRQAFQQNTDAPSADRIHTLIDGETATIGLQVMVIAFLLIIALAVSREMDEASTIGRTG